MSATWKFQKSMLEVIATKKKSQHNLLSQKYKTDASWNLGNTSQLHRNGKGTKFCQICKIL